MQIVNPVTLDLLSCQAVQEAHDPTSVQPYKGKLRDIFQVWAMMEILVGDGFWSRVQMAPWLVDLLM